MDSLDFDGVAFPIAKKLKDFCQLAGGGRCAILIGLKNFGEFQQKAFEGLARIHGINHHAAGAVFKGRLICPKCGVDFQGSAKFKLGMLHQDLTGRQPASAHCPSCESKEAFFLYDDLANEKVTEEDLVSIREYQRHEAQEWWKASGRTGGCCDLCSSGMRPGEGYISGSMVICDSCGEKTYGPDALKKFQDNPNYFGTEVLRRARYWAKTRGQEDKNPGCV